MYVESLKLKKDNSFAIKKLHDLKLENESLEVKIEKSTRRLNKLRVEKESLKVEVKVKALTSDLEKSSIQFQSSSSRSKIIDTMIGSQKPYGNRRDLGFNETNSHAASSSENKSLHASIKSKSVRVLGQRSTVQHRFFST